MRRVDRAAELENALQRVSSEAQASFGDGAVYAEKLVERPRHVEVQVVGDGPAASSPSANASAASSAAIRRSSRSAPRPRFGVAARAALRGGARGGAGGRLQLVRHRRVPAGAGRLLLLPGDEHPAPGRAPGHRGSLGRGSRRGDDPDRPRGAASVLGGGPLAARPRPGVPHLRGGPAPELRALAGQIEALRLPQGPGVRNDVGVEAGSVVPIDYDPMLGKLVVHAPDRPAAVTRLARALAEYEIAGVETTLPLFRALAADADFRAGRYDVQWLDRRLAEGLFRNAAGRRRGSGSPPSPSLRATPRRPARLGRAVRVRVENGRAARSAERLTEMRRLRLVHRGESGNPRSGTSSSTARGAFCAGGETLRGDIARLPDGGVSLILETGGRSPGGHPGQAGEVELVRAGGAAARPRRAPAGPAGARLRRDRGRGATRRSGP